ncbi:hypothetical protein OE749_01640 [Aestuariibacter sp. AA17]|uniref:Uncharacterized protein n=1 Tax=Fluctibacter corallii TaxID=2984329 RepID=A0ABT3A430_9ALTE|nr:hypothetical protein [Aestuariibacter sp. AA17]MCV2883399.1 hypothetical protein [Aestuariibacter sp. AA17]
MTTLAECARIVTQHIHRFLDLHSGQMQAEYVEFYHSARAGIEPLLRTAAIQNDLREQALDAYTHALVKGEELIVLLSSLHAAYTSDDNKKAMEWTAEFIGLMMAFVEAIAADRDE